MNYIYHRPSPNQANERIKWEELDQEQRIKQIFCARDYNYTRATDGLNYLARITAAIIVEGANEPVNSPLVLSHLVSRTAKLNKVLTADNPVAGASAPIYNCDCLCALANQLSCEKVAEFPPSSISFIASGFADMGIRHVELFNKLASAALSKMDEFTPKELSFIASAFATVGIEHHHLFKRIAETVTKKLGLFAEKEIAHIATALAFGYPVGITDILSRQTWQLMTEPGSWLMAYRALIVADEVAPAETVQPPGGFKQQRPSQFSRAFEGRVREWLQNDLFIQEDDFAESDSIAGLSPDIVIDKNGRRVIIECDGERYHRTSGPDGGTLLGKDIVQDRIFHKFGYSVVHIRGLDFHSNRDHYQKEILKALGEA